MKEEKDFYSKMYADFDLNGIKYGDTISGESKGGINFTGKLETVGGGTLGVMFNGIPIEFNAENGGDFMLKETIKKA